MFWYECNWGSGQSPTLNGQIHSIRLTDLDNPANSRFYPAIIRSRTMPAIWVLVDELGDGSTNGTLTNFPAAQPWVPVLGTNQAYLSGRTGGGFTNGINTTSNTMTAADPAGVLGSWGSTPPVVGSNFARAGAQVQVTAVNNTDITYSVTSGTTEEIQAAFEYPNVLTITPPP